MTFLRIIYKDYSEDNTNQELSLDIHDKIFDQAGTYMAYRVNQNGTNAFVISKNGTEGTFFDFGVLENAWNQIKEIPVDNILRLEFYKGDEKIYTIEDTILKVDYCLNFLTRVECINFLCVKKGNEGGGEEWRIPKETV